MTRDKILFCVSLAYLAGDVVVAESSCCSAARPASSLGIPPLNAFCDRLSTRRLRRRPSVAGIGPLGPGLDLSTICSRDDGAAPANSAAGEAAEQGERLEVRHHAEHGSCGAATPAPGCVAAAWSWSRSKMARESAKESEGAIGACGGVYLLAILGGV